MLLTIVIIIINPVSARSFPAVELATGGYKLGGSTVTVNMPVIGGFQTGDLMIVTFCNYGPSGIEEMPAPWSLFDSRASYPNDLATIRLWYRIADEEMDPSVIVPWTGGTAFTTWQAFRIVGHKQDYPSPEPESNGAYTVTSTNTTPNPPILTPTYGAKETMWLAFACVEKGHPAAIFSAIPTEFSVIRTTDSLSDGSTAVSLASVYRNINATSLNPSAFTTDSAVAWTAFTVSIEPQDDSPLVTLPATYISWDKARMNGRLDIVFSSTVILNFQWGDTLSLGNESANITKSSPDTLTGTYYINVIGLQANHTYYFRAHSLEVPSGYESFGDILNFTTSVYPEMLTDLYNGIIILVFVTLVIMFFIAVFYIRRRGA
jgi:hypothetical protein